MTAMPFKEEFAPAVEDGSKGQTIRKAECKHEKVECGGESLTVRKEVQIFATNPPQCYLECHQYEHRIKPGDTLQLYTGMMQGKYCKGQSKTPPFCDAYYRLGNYNYDSRECNSKDCTNRGAKLLKTATCTESFPIKFEDLTEEIAELDGFKGHKIRAENWTYVEGHFPLDQLKDFLIKEYKAKPGDVFQVIRWRPT